MDNKETKKLIDSIYSYFNINIWCEKCSTENHPILMEPTERGLWHTCPLCKHQVMVMVDLKLNVGSHYSNDCKKCQELEKDNITFGRKKK